MKPTSISMCIGILTLISCGDPATADDNNKPITNFCATTTDCPAMGDLSGWPEFQQQKELVCRPDIDGNGYCTECLFDSNCEAGFGCVNRTYCKELDSCITGRDCAGTDSQVHLACKKNLCAPCDDEFQCEVQLGEMCYNKLCVPRVNVDPTCIDATCETSCDITNDVDGNPKGFECVKK